MGRWNSRSAKLKTERFPLVKVLPLQVVFLLLHFLYEWASGPVTAIFSEQVVLSRGLKWFTVALLAITLSEFIIFTYRLPWLDVFANPPGW